MIKLFAVTIFLLSSCAQNLKPVVIKEVTPRWETVKGYSSWTPIVQDALMEHGKYLLSGEVKDWNTFCAGNCSSMTQGEKLIYWTYLLSLMMEKESYFNPSLTYKENFKDREGNYVISSGLFQLSLESSQGYNCGFKKQIDLFSVKGNINCAVRIMNHLVSQDKQIVGKKFGEWKGGPRYWGVLRDTRTSYEFIVAEMKKAFK